MYGISSRISCPLSGSVAEHRFLFSVPALSFLILAESGKIHIRKPGSAHRFFHILGNESRMRPAGSPVNEFIGYGLQSP